MLMNRHPELPKSFVIVQTGNSLITDKCVYQDVSSQVFLKVPAGIDATKLVFCLLRAPHTLEPDVCAILSIMQRRHTAAELQER